MSQKKSPNTAIIVLLSLFATIFIILLPRLLTMRTSGGVVPISGLPERSHFVLFFIILPPIFTIAVVLIFPRIIPKLILKSKKLIYRRYKDAYLDIEPEVFSLKKIAARLIYIFLLNLGFLAIIIPLMNEEFAKMFISPQSADIYTSEGLDLRFATPVLFQITFCIVLPIVIGLWSVGWALQDSGLLHYVGLEGQKERWDKLFEIEPIHAKYNNYLKGYAGISSIVFLITLVVYFAGFEGRAEDVMWVIVAPALTMIIAMPSYVVYGLSSGKFQSLKNGLPQVKKIAEKELIINDK